MIISLTGRRKCGGREEGDGGKRCNITLNMLPFDCHALPTTRTSLLSTYCLGTHDWLHRVNEISMNMAQKGRDRSVCLGWRRDQSERREVDEWHE